MNGRDDRQPLGSFILALARYASSNPLKVRRHQTLQIKVMT